jgi:hypothetical protein
MEPILSKLERKDANNSAFSIVNPVDEITSIDMIHKSTLLQPNALAQKSTRITRVVRETTDDD